MSGRNLAHALHPVILRDTVKSWLREDTPNFDYGGFVVGENIETAVLLCKGIGVIAGIPFVTDIFDELGCSIEWFVKEGQELDATEEVIKVANIKGKVRHLLLGERIALNCMCRASGIATYARKLKEKVTGWHGELAGTRKTTPGFRLVEKYALLVGGISTHRYDLSSMVMLKDNHIWTAGNIAQAVKDARSVCGFSTKIEVECRSVEEGTEAAEAGADVVMLDNFSSQAIHVAAEQLKSRFPHILIEASGGINELTVKQFAGPDIDIISMSKTTQGYEVVDFSMKIQKQDRDPSNPTVKT